MSSLRSDLIVLNRIIESIGCGTLVKPSGDRDRYNISVANISELVDIILPLFQNNPLYGAKGADFLDFSKGISIIRDKRHLTPEGLKKLKDLSSHEHIQKVLIVCIYFILIFKLCTLSLSYYQV